MAYRVNEIFYTLQGEGAHSGIPAVFVRFSGCNLRCPWCDTEFAEYKEMSAKEIVDEMQTLYDTPNERRKMCVLTGGEPSLQVDKPLIDTLHEAGFYICIETNGTHPLPEGIDWITCSPKEGSLHHSATEIWRKQLEAEHWLLQPLRYNGEWLLLSGIDDFEIDSNDNLDDTVRYILAHPFWRLSVQLHKIAGLR